MEMTPIAQPRRVVCGRCAAAFECRAGGGCWCADEAFRLPLPQRDADCLCPTCLRAAACVALAQPIGSK